MLKIVKSVIFLRKSLDKKNECVVGYLRMNIWQQSLRGFRNLFNSQSFEFEYLRCVRDWSGILLERSGKRYSGKPDGLPERPN